MDSSFPVLPVIPTNLHDLHPARVHALPPESAGSECESPAEAGKPSDAAVHGVRLRGAPG